jgi:hypothetical protein
MDCQCSLCFLLIQSPITPLAIFADIPSAGSGPMNGCEQPCQANWSAISFASIPICPGTHTSWILLCSASLTRDWWQSRLVWNLTGSCQGPLWLPTVRKDIDVPTSIIQALMVYISAWNTVVWSPRLKLCPLLQPHLYTPAPVPLLVLDPDCVPDQAPFVVWDESILPFTLVTELDCEWLVVCISRKHPVRPHL